MDCDCGKIYVEIRFSNCEDTFLIHEDDLHFITDKKIRKSDGYCCYGNGSNKLHRLIMNSRPDQEVDHKNMNKTDNRRCNLRFCTRQENICNVGKRKGNYTSNYKGVYWHKLMNKWRAQIQTNGIGTRLGYFDDEIDAARAYNNAAKELHGEFARLNDVDNIIEFVSFDPAMKLKPYQRYAVFKSTPVYLKDMYKKIYNQNITNNGTMTINNYYK